MVLKGCLKIETPIKVVSVLSKEIGEVDICTRERHRILSDFNKHSRQGEEFT